MYYKRRKHKLIRDISILQLGSSVTSGRRQAAPLDRSASGVHRVSTAVAAGFLLMPGVAAPLAPGGSQKPQQRSNDEESASHVEGLIVAASPLRQEPCQAEAGGPLTIVQILA